MESRETPQEQAMPRIKGEENGKKEVKKEPKPETDSIRYPSIQVKVVRVTVKLAKELLGWTEENEEKFKDDYFFIDRERNKIRCFNNTHNRPFTEVASLTYAQDILNQFWKLNGEAIIVGKYGSVLSGQHRLIGLILAAQVWAGEKQHDHWIEKWSEEPYIDSVITYGIEEDQETIRTLDNVRSRTAADVLFTDQSVFGGATISDRKRLCRMAEYAIRLVWQRTGTGDPKVNPFSPKLTNSEVVDFLQRHHHLSLCVKHISEEDKKKAIGSYISPGSAAGMMYLMAVSESDIDVYRLAPIQDEGALNLSRWEQAQEFWVRFAESKKEFEPVRMALRNLKDPNNPEVGGGGTLAERLAILCKAWNVFVEGGKLSDDDVKLHYVHKGDELILGERPSVGGIDLDAESAEAQEEKMEEDDPEPPTEEEIETRKAEERERRENKKKAKKEKVKESKPKRMTQKQINEEQTRKAREADELLAKEKKLKPDHGLTEAGKKAQKEQLSKKK